jgi:hypothetical protein
MTDPDSPVRRDQEPRGRWEGHCDFIRKTGTIAPIVICDRPDGHKGMHSGRLIDTNSEGQWVVRGYARLRT